MFMFIKLESLDGFSSKVSTLAYSLLVLYYLYFFLLYAWHLNMQSNDF